jgi:4-hydroxyphenylpyruvate dioxygenase-like putative hemolysin
MLLSSQQGKSNGVQCMHLRFRWQFQKQGSPQRLGKNRDHLENENNKSSKHVCGWMIYYKRIFYFKAVKTFSIIDRIAIA